MLLKNILSAQHCRYKLHPRRGTTRGGALPLDNNGDVLFLRNSTSITVRKTSDNWSTHADWIDINSAYGGKIDESNGIALGDDKLLVAFKHDTDALKNGWYILEKVDATTFRFDKVLTMTVNNPSNAFGKDKYPLINPTIILLTEYDETLFSRHVHLSEDGGETWRTIFELPKDAEVNIHTHSAHYDPYADRIWVCNGDGGVANLWYSDDWRNETPTWTRCWNVGSAPCQFTCMFSTEDMFLLASDGVGENGIWGIRRIPKNLVPDVVNIKPIYIVDNAKSVLFVGRSFKQNSKGEIYITLSNANNSKYKGEIILGSKDRGKSWYKVYEAPPGFDNSFTNLWLTGNKVIWWEYADKMIIDSCF